MQCSKLYRTASSWNLGSPKQCILSNTAVFTLNPKRKHAPHPVFISRLSIISSWLNRFFNTDFNVLTTWCIDCVHASEIWKLIFTQFNWISLVLKLNRKTCYTLQHIRTYNLGTYLYMVFQNWSSLLWLKSNSYHTQKYENLVFTIGIQSLP